MAVSSKKMVTITLNDYCATDRTMGEWLLFKSVLAEVLLEGSWSTSRDENCIYVLDSVFNILQSLNYQEISAKDLKCVLQKELSDDYQHAKLEEQHETLRAHQALMDSHYTLFNRNKKMMQSIGALLTQVEGLQQFVYQELLGNWHIPHLRMTVNNIEEAKAVRNRLEEGGFNVSIYLKGNDFLVVVKGLADRYKFQQFSNDYMDKKNSAEGKTMGLC